MSPESFIHLEQLGFTRGTEQVDRDKLADATLEQLLAQPVDSEEQIQERALIVPELRMRVVGSATAEIDHELDGVFAQLTGPKGLVQKKLNGSMTLCSTSVRRTLSNNGEPGEVTVIKPGRFVTANDDLADEYYVQRWQKGLVRAAKNYKEGFELAISRHPRLAARYQAQIASTYTTLELEMPRQR